jgi:hypothetical protein
MSEYLQVSAAGASLVSIGYPIDAALDLAQDQKAEREQCGLKLETFRASLRVKAGTPAQDKAWSTAAAQAAHELSAEDRLGSMVALGDEGPNQKRRDEGAIGGPCQPSNEVRQAVVGIVLVLSVYYMH